eukprot:Nk52_evm42s2579 gene=Nk52_evmTU42s2579
MNQTAERNVTIPEGNCSSPTTSPSFAPSLSLSSSSPSQIAEFFSGKNVFITGGTGFMGKVLVEKILRSCPTVKQLFLLVRPKKDTPAKERIEQILDPRLFAILKKEQPDYADKITILPGNLVEPNLGLCQEHLDLLIEQVQIVLHCAATVSFNEHLRTAFDLNVIGTLRVMEICMKSSNLVSFVHVSTAYANCNHKHIEEEVYTHNMTAEQLKSTLDWMTDEQIENITPILVGKRPNTYTYTKSIAETVVFEYRHRLPVSIVRPSIVGATLEEPFAGWTDTLMGPGGLYLACGKGVLRVMKGDPNAVADIVPVDLVVGMVLAVAWRTADEFKARRGCLDGAAGKSAEEEAREEANLRVINANPESFNQVSVKSPYCPIYNCTSGDKNPVLWRELADYVMASFKRYPLEEVFRRPNFTHYKDPVVFKMWHMVAHTLPAAAADMVAFVCGSKPRMLRAYNRLEKHLDAYYFFTSNDWSWSYVNPENVMECMNEEDMKLFDYDVGRINWHKYTEDFCLGVKKYVLKEDMSRLQVARRTQMKLRATRMVFTLGAFAIVFRYVMKRIRQFRMQKTSYLFLLNPLTISLMKMLLNMYNSSGAPSSRNSRIPSSGNEASSYATNSPKPLLSLPINATQATEAAASTHL